MTGQLVLDKSSKMKKGIKYTIGTIIIGIVLYNSMYFRPLDEKLAEDTEEVFDAQTFVDQLWGEALQEVYRSATDLNALFTSLRENKIETFEKESEALGIGNIGYFKVKVEGTVLQINENNVLLLSNDQVVEIETEFIFGNAVRDASGLIRINDFDETSDFNNISEAINQTIRSKVVPDFRAAVEKGDRVIVYGAIQLNKAHLDLEQPEVVPVYIEIVS